MVLRNDGQSGTVNISGKKGGHLFNKYVESGNTFTYQSNGKMDNSIFINGADIHTSCSQPLYAGMKVGDFTLVSATSARTDEILCTLPVEPPVATTGKVCGVVFYDENANARQDNGEEGTKGILVSVLDANGDVKRGRTRASGAYCINDVAVGDVTVTVKESTLPVNAELTVGNNPSDITVIGNKRNYAGKDGYIFQEGPVNETGKVCGTLFNDENNNGKQDTNEEGEASIFIKIVSANGDKSYGKTNATGNYCIANVPSGSAEVIIMESTLPNNATLTSGQNPSNVTVIANQDNNAGKDGYNICYSFCDE